MARPWAGASGAPTRGQRWEVTSSDVLPKAGPWQRQASGVSAPSQGHPHGPEDNQQGEAPGSAARCAEAQAPSEGWRSQGREAGSSS